MGSRNRRRNRHNSIPLNNIPNSVPPTNDNPKPSLRKRFGSFIFRIYHGFIGIFRKKYRDRSENEIRLIRKIDSFEQERKSFRIQLEEEKAKLQVELDNAKLIYGEQFQLVQQLRSRIDVLTSERDSLQSQLDIANMEIEKLQLVCERDVLRIKAEIAVLIKEGTIVKKENGQ